ncbi:MAG: hypothetical protein LBN25_00145, partial [Christensenellaceae bacterium]|nr:hypothetical protein [Christensenellaceae bacterium]
MKTKLIKKEIRELLKRNTYQLLLVFVAFITMVLVSVIFVRSILNTRMRDISKQTIETTVTGVDGMLERMELMITEAARHTTDVLTEDISKTEEIREYIYDVSDYFMEGDNTSLDEMLTIYTVIDGPLIDKWVYFDGTRWGDENYPEIADLEAFAEYNPKVRDWYIGALATKDGESYFSEPYIDAQLNIMCITIARHMEIPGLEDSVISIDLKMDMIADYVQSQVVLDSGYGLLISNDGSFVTHPDKNYIGEPLSGIYERLADAINKAMKVNGNVEAFRFKDYDGTDSIAFFSPLYSGWYVGIIVPYGNYMESVNIMTVIISLLGGALAILLSALLLQATYRRMKSEEESASKSTFL